MTIKSIKRLCGVQKALPRIIKDAFLEGFSVSSKHYNVVSTTNSQRLEDLAAAYTATVLARIEAGWMDEAGAGIEFLKNVPLLIAKAAQRYVGLANAGDGHTCRWCGGTNCAHTAECPIKGLIDIVMIVAAKTDTDREIAREALANIAPLADIDDTIEGHE